jgi:hypothetical protein
MKPIPNDLYEKIEHVSDTVRKTFRQRGIIIPVKNSDGSINIGRYRVVNENTGFYSVYDSANESVVQGINLPQTAALLANDLALGKMLDFNMVNQDRQYGWSLFEETLYKQRVKDPKSDLTTFEIAKMKETISRNRREQFQRTIIQRFEKLRRLV